MMKTIFAASLALCATAATAQAQPQQGPQAPQAQQAPTPEIQAAGQAFGLCIGTAIEAAPPTTAPEAAASNALAGCASQQTALVSAIEAFINASDMPAEQKQAALAQVRTQFAQAQTQIATAIREARAADAAAPNTPPAPAQ